MEAAIFIFSVIVQRKRGMAAHAQNLHTLEAEAGRSLKIQGQLELCNGGPI